MSLSGPKWDQGRIGEEAIKRWLQRQGFLILPASQIENGGAPMLEGLRFRAVLPDHLAFLQGAPRWVEVKTKGRATLYQKTRTWEHGLKLDNWLDYLACQSQTGIDGWLCIWELESRFALLQRLNHLDRVKRIYNGNAMPDGKPHVFFPRDEFDWHEGPSDLDIPSGPVVPITPTAARTLSQPAAPTHRQLSFGLPARRVDLH